MFINNARAWVKKKKLKIRKIIQLLYLDWLMLILLGLKIVQENNVLAICSTGFKINCINVLFKNIKVINGSLRNVCYKRTGRCWMC